jgi:hypothetical protein
MAKDSIQIICPSCGAKIQTEWPTPRQRRAEIACPSCKASFPIAKAVERTIIGEHDRHDMQIVPKRDGSERS